MQKRDFSARILGLTTMSVADQEILPVTQRLCFEPKTRRRNLRAVLRVWSAPCSEPCLVSVVFSEPIGWNPKSQMVELAAQKQPTTLPSLYFWKSHQFHQLDF